MTHLSILLFVLYVKNLFIIWINKYPSVWYSESSEGSDLNCITLQKLGAQDWFRACALFDSYVAQRKYSRKDSMYLAVILKNAQRSCCGNFMMIRIQFPP